MTTDAPELFALISSAGTRQTIPVKKTGEWQHLNMIFEVAKPGEYLFALEAKGKNLARYWLFQSCDVTTWKK